MSDSNRTELKRTDIALSTLWAQLGSRLRCHYLAIGTRHIRAADMDTFYLPRRSIYS